jgi:hypothetical protein
LTTSTAPASKKAKVTPSPSATRVPNTRFDLSQQHVDEFHDALAKYIGAAQKVSGRHSPSTTTSPRSNKGTTKPDKTQLGAIRTWAREHGHTVSDRGRISQEVMDAYNTGK